MVTMARNICAVRVTARPVYAIGNPAESIYEALNIYYLWSLWWSDNGNVRQRYIKIGRVHSSHPIDDDD